MSSIFNFNENRLVKNQQISGSFLSKKGVELYIKREDEIHPFVSGNKFRKLKYNIYEAIKVRQKTLLTFGGAFSNHILATASAAQMSGLNSIGIIRGDELGKDIRKTLASNPTLQKAHGLGMKFHFISREEYRQKSEPSFIDTLRSKFGDFYLIPEGGTNELAIKGCEEIITEKDNSFDVLAICVGTGGTIAGIINASEAYQNVIGFPVLKGNFLQKEIQQFVSKTNWKLQPDFHFGGYAKYDETLINFINTFYKEYKIPLDPIYTGKMMFGLFDLIKNDYFRIGTKILAIHTGGLQGIDGFNERLSKKGSSLKIIK